MGQFAIIISGIGGHGCERGVKDGETVLGCNQPNCPDCIAREFVRRLKRNSITELKAELVHWPAAIDTIDGLVDDVSETLGYADLTLEPHVAAKYALVIPQGSSVIDDLVTGTRHGSF